MQTWAQYEGGELAKIVDTSITDDAEIEEACKYLKIALLCTQDASKLRPAMSTVHKMLMGKSDIDSDKITKPGLISDFMDLKIRDQNKPIGTNNSSSTMSSSVASPLSSMDTTRATMTFTAISDRE